MSKKITAAVRVKICGNGACIDCNVPLIINNNEYTCPKCGLVKEIMDGA